MQCPQPQCLQQLLDEALPAEQQQAIQAHLETCAACQKTVERLAAGGVTWDKTAQNLGAAPARDETALNDAVAKLQGQTTDADQTHAGPASPPVSDDLAFLQPAQKPGSLGRLDEFEIMSIVGRGGFGIVLKAFDEELHRVVAIKVMAPQLAASGAARERFIREAKAAAAVSHENVVTIHKVEKKAKIPYLAMQFVNGVTLNEKLDKGGPVSVKEILRIGMQIAEGLAAAHKQGLVHRDIKPANILLENGVERVKITDFGLARAVDDASVTQSGTVAGTPMYMSPEQAEGLPVDHRSDLFSLGTVLYAMCTGHPPFRASGTHAVLKRVIDASPRPIREINSDIPEWLCDIIGKLHAKKPEDRFQTAREVAEILGQHLAHLQQPTVTARPANVQPSPPTPAPAGNLATNASIPIKILGVLAIFAVGVFAAGAEVLHAAGLDMLRRPLFLTAAGLYAFTAVLVYWRYRRVRQANPWLSPRMAGFFVIVAVACFARSFFSFDQQPGIVELQWDNPGLYIVLSGDPKNGRHMINAAKRYEGRADVVPIQEEGGPALMISAAKLREELELPPGNYKIRAWFAFPDGQVTDATENIAVQAGVRTRIVLPEWGQIHIPQAAPDDQFFVNGKQLAPKRIDGKVAHLYLLPKGEINWEVKRRGASVGAGIVSLRGGMIYTAYVRPPEPGWVQLFDGKTLAGWKEFGDNRVRDGEITLFPGAAIDTIDKMPRTFHLGMEVKLIAGEGMIRIHAPPRAKHTLDGEFYEGWTFRFAEAAGGIVDATLSAVGNTAPAALSNIYAGHQAKRGEWFYLEIIAKENVTEVRIDGRRLDLPLKGQAPAAGVISLANIGRRDSKIMFRNIAIKDSTPPVSEPGWVQLFNGKDLSGWKKHPVEPGDWKVENGLLIGSGRLGYLFSERGDYQNFHLRVEAKLNAGGDSGVFFRSRFQPLIVQPEVKSKSPAGYEVQINNDSLKTRTGSLFFVETGSEIPSLTREDRVLTHPDQWCTLEVIADGPWLTVKVNGERTAYVKNAVYGRGHLALQIWPENTVIQFKKIEIKELPASKTPATAPPFVLVLPNRKSIVMDTLLGRLKIEVRADKTPVTVQGLLEYAFEKIAIEVLPPAEPAWVSLFNGKDLTGWETFDKGTGRWKVVDGNLTCDGPRSYLFTKRDDYKDFHFRIEARLNAKGNSGQYFRCRFGPGWPKGYYAQINNSDPGAGTRTGALNRVTLSGGFESLVNVPGGLVLDNAWFTQEMIAKGNHLQVLVNGKKVADYIDKDRMFMQGRLALEHMTEPTRIEFRKIEIKELPRPAE